MSNKIILLNSDFNPIKVISVRKAIKLISRNKVEGIGSKYIKVKTIVKEIVVPRVLRLLNYIKLNYRRTVNYSRKMIYERDMYICQYCSAKLTNKNISLDHVIPISKGGKNTFENLVTSCKKCNHRKGPKLMDEIGYSLIKHPTRPDEKTFLKYKLKDVSDYSELLQEIGFDL